MGRLTTEQVKIKYEFEKLVAVLFKEAGISNDSEFKALHDSRRDFDTNQDYLDWASRILKQLVWDVFLTLREANTEDIKRVKKAVLK